ncbi:hypothetical protein [Pseudosulfitobacter pseudonitzschiae]|uniref:hypothetical protein n=1 Tax=Pseudosulfitobacter pseudonitzschiae TaxID=1402135 RepID=UPI001AF99EC4|nr:hypothetical protein [Pseudosulfitobacter pseudonitzschiae]MBM1813997.1 hypothetical protein [Pseudosulfitobacter pseudonitzschiae]MBM1830990.1 hypothetical protein [Pseudosulfitobacter pseudonitzschiae]MBM1835857.1 hypothetical protein [Pseudosulfitobacter pseudonitzschiae]MBM1840703.1 hypothetical protein [Pseudosulfitobacter pseudonitzschiae]MBM1845309.1 hypothetical protein [Pseudosulfitobacter pseudonitzschiae]
MARLILHIGHGKTGSSALQSALALSTDALAAQGIAYPDHASLAQARAGQITAGNVNGRTLVATAKAALKRSAQDVLLSNESLIHFFLNDPDLLSRVANLGVPVQLILYVRNPFDHACSVYGQTVKRGGADISFDAFLAGYPTPSKVREMIRLADRAGVDLTVINYSNHAADILRSLTDALGVPADTLTPAAAGRVNRSLTRSEMELQRMFNRHWGRRSSRFVSDALCNALPEIRADRPVASARALDAFVARQTPIVAEVNALLPPSEAYRLEVPGDAPGTEDQSDLTFTPEQMEVLVRAISERIPNVLENDRWHRLLIRLRGGQHGSVLKSLKSKITGRKNG